MIDYAKRMRVPALIAVLGVIALFTVIAIGYFVFLVSDGMALTEAARLAGANSPSLIWVFVGVALALSVVLGRPSVEKAGRLVGAASIVVIVATAIALVFWVLGLFGGLTLGALLGALGGLVETAAKAACAAVLWRLRGLADEEAARVEASVPSTGDGGQSPVWNPQQAIGLQWSRAGDAASGALAASVAQPAALPPAPEPVVEPAPRRQLWSRGGIAPEQLTAAPAEAPSSRALDVTPQVPWATAAQAADGLPAGPAEVSSPPAGSPARRAPDWTPAPRPQEPNA